MAIVANSTISVTQSQSGSDITQSKVTTLTTKIVKEDLAASSQSLTIGLICGFLFLAVVIVIVSVIVARRKQARNKKSYLDDDFSENHVNIELDFQGETKK